VVEIEKKLQDIKLKMKSKSSKKKNFFRYIVDEELEFHL
jgi:hypothetical protein